MNELTPVIEELTKVLEGKASRSEIEEEAYKFANTYGVTDPEKIKATLLRKYTVSIGGSVDFVTANRVQKKIDELTGSEMDFDILVKIVYVEKKNVVIRGAPKTIVSGTVGDETGTTQFTVWDGENCELNQGSVYTFKNAYAKLWNDKAQINLGNRGRILPENVTLNVPVAQTQGSAPSASPGAKMKIADLKGSEPNVDLDVKAIFSEKKDIVVKGEPRTIISGTVGDETGSAQFTVWNAAEISIETGQCYTFKSAYTKLWNDLVQINLGNKSTVEKLDREIVTSSAPVVGNASATPAPGIRKNIGDLAGSESNVDLVVKVVFSEKRNVSIKGENREIISGILGDETGTASFTAWDSSIGDMEKGSVLRISNAYTKLWNDQVQINLGSRCTIAHEDAEITVPNTQPAVNLTDATVTELKDGMGSISVSGKIISIESRNVQIKGEDRTVWSGLFADGTGKVQFSAWKDFGLSEGDAIRIDNGYVRGWKGIPQLNLGDRTEVVKIADTFGDMSDISSTYKSIGDIIATGGGIDMEIRGTVVELRQGSGIIRRCPECNRSVLTDECMSHGTVEPVLDLRMKIFIDDGTGAMSAIINRNLTEKLCGYTLDDAIETSGAIGEASVAKELASKISFKRITLRGNVMSDEYGPSIVASDAELTGNDVQERGESLLAAIKEVIM